MHASNQERALRASWWQDWDSWQRPHWNESHQEQQQWNSDGNAWEAWHHREVQHQNSRRWNNQWDDDHGDYSETQQPQEGMASWLVSSASGSPRSDRPADEEEDWGPSWEDAPREAGRHAQQRQHSRPGLAVNGHHHWLGLAPEPGLARQEWPGGFAARQLSDFIRARQAARIPFPGMQQDDRLSDESDSSDGWDGDASDQFNHRFNDQPSSSWADEFRNFAAQIHHRPPRAPLPPRPPLLPEVEEEVLREKWHRDPESFSAFMCPILQAVMRDPVITSDGHTYEREAIESWFQSSRKSPVTGADLPSRRLTPNHGVRTLLRTLIESVHKDIEAADEREAEASLPLRMMSNTPCQCSQEDVALPARAVATQVFNGYLLGEDYLVLSPGAVVIQLTRAEAATGYAFGVLLVSATSRDTSQQGWYPQQYVQTIPSENSWNVELWHDWNGADYGENHLVLPKGTRVRIEGATPEGWADVTVLSGGYRLQHGNERGVEVYVSTLSAFRGQASERGWLPVAYLQEV